MAWNSVRVRLTLWNICILALVLGGFGFAFCYTVQVTQSKAIDDELRMRAHPPDDRGPGGPRGFGVPGGPAFFFLRGRGPWDRLQPPDFVGPPNLAGGRMGVRVLERRSFRGPDGREPNRRPGTPSPAERRRFRQGFRMFDLQAKSLGPPGTEDHRPWDPVGFVRASHGQELLSTVVVEGERLRVLSVPMRWEGKVQGVAQHSHSLAELDRLLENQYRTLFFLIPAALLVAGVGGLFLTSRALRPVRKVTQAAAQIGAEDLSQRLEVTGKDELAELAATFNGMIARLEGAFQSREEAYHRLESAYQEQRRFTADASHELRTPLARIKGITSLALFGPRNMDDYHEALTIADQAADVMNRIVQDLLLLARSDAGQLTPRYTTLHVESLLLGAADRLQGHPGAPIRLELPAEPLQLRGDEDHLTRVLVNLLENAVRHTPESGEVILSARREEEQVLLTVSDNGEGIPAEHLPHLCERFYRVDAARTRADGGTGLGLAICESIVQAHGGALTIRSRVGLGTTVEVRLPGQAAPLLPAAPAGLCA